MLDPILYQMQADLCQAMSHPARQLILHMLFDGPLAVGEIARLANLEQPTVSRHIAILKQRGIVNTSRRGQEVICSVTNPKIAEVCGLMRNVLAEQMKERSRIAKEINRE